MDGIFILHSFYIPCIFCSTHIPKLQNIFYIFTFHLVGINTPIIPTKRYFSIQNYDPCDYASPLPPKINVTYFCNFVFLNNKNSLSNLYTCMSIYIYIYSQYDSFPSNRSPFYYLGDSNSTKKRSIYFYLLFLENKSNRISQKTTESVYSFDVSEFHLNEFSNSRD